MISKLIFSSMRARAMKDWNRESAHKVSSGNINEEKHAIVRCQRHLKLGGLNLTFASRGQPRE